MTPYMPPLRGAVCFLFPLAGDRLISHEAIAVLAQTTEARALAYCSILVKQDALLPDSGAYRIGPRWTDWASTPCRSRPSSGLHMEATETKLNRLRRVICKNLGAERQRQSLSIVELEQRSGVNRSVISRAEKFCDPPSACALVLLAQALGTSIDQLALSPA